MYYLNFKCAVLCLVAQACPTLCGPMDCSPPGSSVHGHSPGKNIGVGCYALLQGIFPTQGLNPGLLHGRWILYQLSYQESPFKCLTTFNYKLNLPHSLLSSTNHWRSRMETKFHHDQCIPFHPISGTERIVQDTRTCLSPRTLFLNLFLNTTLLKQT